MNTTITWNQAQHIPGPEDNQQKYIEQFLSEFHEMTDVRDLIHYQEKTGKTFDWLIQNAEGIAPNIKAAVMLTCGEYPELTIDDIYDLQPDHPPVLDKPDRILDAGAIHVLYYPFPCSENYKIMICDNEQEVGWWYPDENTQFTKDACEAVSDKDLINFFDAEETKYLRS